MDLDLCIVKYFDSKHNIRCADTHLRSFEHLGYPTILTGDYCKKIIKWLINLITS